MKLLFSLSFIIGTLFIIPGHAKSDPTLLPDYSVEGLNGRKHGGNGQDHLIKMKAQLPIKPVNYAVASKRASYGF